MNLSIDSSSEVPIYAQITQQISALIDDGRMAQGAALPSIRDLASQLQTSAVTVKRAYDSLETQGLIETVSGKGSFVAKRWEDVDAGMTQWKAFWSYSRRDDELSRGRISLLADDIAAEYELETGDKIDLFKDTESIGWGDSWPKTIEENLNSTVFFIPVLTPTYLRRPSCLGELKTAFRRLSELGLSRVIFPIRYADISSFMANSPDDDLVQLINNTQHNDWTDLRNKDRDSEEYRSGIEKIVGELISIDTELIEIQKRLRLETSDLTAEDSDENEYSLLEDLVALEEGMQEFTFVSEELTVIIKGIGDVARMNTEKIKDSDRQNKGFAGRLAVSRSFATELEDPSEKLGKKCSEFTSIVKKMDRGIRAFVSLAVKEIEVGSEDAEGILTFFRSLKELSDSSTVSFDNVRGFSDSVSTIEKFSRDLKAPSKKIRAALTDFESNEATIKGWVQLIDGTGIDYAVAE